MTQVSPPPGVDPRLVTPLTGPARELALLDLDAIIAAASVPSYLNTAEASSDPKQTTDDNADPPLAAQKFFAAGRQAFLEGDNFQAVQQLEKALRLAPGQSEILQALGQAWTRAGNRVSASNYFRQAYAANPNDVDSLFLLGRFALEDRRWDEAILCLSRVLDIATSPQDAASDNPPVDPATAPLARFFLANALNQAGYARAASTVYQDYLANDRGAIRATPQARELMVIDAQQGETLLLVGDLHHRLDEPEVSLEVYQVADEVGVLNADGLRRRLIYTRLRLGQTRAAGDLAVEAVDESSGTGQSLALIPYVVEQGVSADRLADRLTELYESEGEPASLALAMADVLPDAAAARLLQRHLAKHPEDSAVFGRLVTRLVESPSVTSHDRAQALHATAAAMQSSPDAAAAYLDELFKHIEAPADWRVAFDEHIDMADPQTDGKPQLYVLRGRLASAAGDLDAAEAAYRSALELEPAQHIARVELAALCIQQQEWDAANDLLEPMAESNDPRVADLRARALIATGQDEEALALLDEVLRRSPPGSPLMLDKAKIQLRLDRVADAERTLLDALNTRPTDEDIYELLLDIYNEHGDMVRNYQRLVRRMIDTIPTARITRLELSNLHLASRDFAAAEKLLDGLYAEDPSDTAVQRMLVEVYAGTNRPDALGSMVDQHMATAGGDLDEELLTTAERFYAQTGDTQRWLELMALRLEAQAPSLERTEQLARVRLTQERYDDAIGVIQEAIDQGLAGDQPGQLSLLLAQIHFSQKKYEQASAAAKQALTQGVSKEDTAAAVFVLSRSLGESGRLADAEAEFDMIAEKYPDFAGDYGLDIAVQYENHGDTEASRRVMQQTLKRFPDHPQLNNALGYAWANEGIHLDEAHDMIKRAVDAEPDVAAYLDSFGWVFYKQGRFDEARDWLRRGRAATGGDHPVIIDHLGDTLYRLGRNAEAVRTWGQAQAVLSAPDFDSEDPEVDGLDGRLQAKIDAVGAEQPAEVAPLGEGVVVPDLPAADAPEPMEEPEPAPAAEEAELIEL